MSVAKMATKNIGAKLDHLSAVEERHSKVTGTLALVAVASLNYC